MHTHASSHKPKQSADVENPSAGIEHSVIPRTLLKGHVGESTLNSFLFFFFFYTHMWVHTDTWKHCRHVDTRSYTTTYTHTCLNTHTYIYAKSNIMNTAGSRVQSDVTVFESSAGFEWLLFFLFWVCGLRWSKMNGVSDKTGWEGRLPASPLCPRVCVCVLSGGEHGHCLSREPVL